MRIGPATILITCICGAILPGCDNYNSQQPTNSRERTAPVSPGQPAPLPTTPADSPRLNPATSPDNTGINQRDRGDSTLLPTDQGGASSDIELTQMIRKRITAMDGLSMNARNIKIITLNGQVTLRGPVNSQAERDQIVAIAQELAGPNPVVNELEVTIP